MTPDVDGNLARESLKTTCHLTSDVIGIGGGLSPGDTGDFSHPPQMLGSSKASTINATVSQV